MTSVPDYYRPWPDAPNPLYREPDYYDDLEVKRIIEQQDNDEGENK